MKVRQVVSAVELICLSFIAFILASDVGNFVKLQVIIEFELGELARLADQEEACSTLKCPISPEVTAHGQITEIDDFLVDGIGDGDQRYFQLRHELRHHEVHIVDGVLYGKRDLLVRIRETLDRVPDSERRLRVS